MTIHQIAERLNIKAIEEGFAISTLPQLRKIHLHKKQLPNKIFTSKTIKSGEDKYAFHYGGRDEMQFNIGEEFIGEKTSTRCSLSFSLEASRSLTNPVELLEPYRQRFNYCFENHPELFIGFKMWYFQNGQRHSIVEPQTIPDSWFQSRTFICLGIHIEKPLSELNENDYHLILSCFDKLLPIYKYTVLENHISEPREKIFTRLISNENNWELPSTHKWKKENQRKPNVAFENQYGYGYEEWLLNPRYNTNDFQYGYIRGMYHSKQSILKYDEVHLYTVKRVKTSNHVYYVGLIRNVFLIRNNLAEQMNIATIISQYSADMASEIESVNGDVMGLKRLPFTPVVKFKIKDVLFFENPIYQPKFNLGKYKRLQPYKLSGSIGEIFEDTNESDSSGFLAGKSNQTYKYNRASKESSRTIEKLHSEIVDALEAFLNPTYSLKAKNLSIEKTRFNGNIADIVTKESDSSITIYEVKTSASGRRNIRDAISQLLDYALHSFEKVNKLIIVAPSSLNPQELIFLTKLQNSINIPIEYLCYAKCNSVKFTSHQ